MYDTDTITEHTLPGTGRVVKLQMPDLYAIVGVNGLPDLALAPVLRFLRNGALKKASGPMAEFEADVEWLRGVLGIAQLCLVEPRLYRSEAEARAKGGIGPRDLSLKDFEYVYYDFFLLRDQPFAAPLAGPPEQPDGHVDPLPHGEGIPGADASATPGDH